MSTHAIHRPRDPEMGGGLGVGTTEAAWRKSTNIVALPL